MRISFPFWFYTFYKFSPREISYRILVDFKLNFLKHPRYIFLGVKSLKPTRIIMTLNQLAVLLMLLVLHHLLNWPSNQSLMQNIHQRASLKIFINFHSGFKMVVAMKNISIWKRMPHFWDRICQTPFRICPITILISPKRWKLTQIFINNWKTRRLHLGLLLDIVSKLVLIIQGIHTLKLSVWLLVMKNLMNYSHHFLIQDCVFQYSIWP